VGGRAALPKLGLRGVALGYLTVLLVFPLAMVGFRTFEHGIDAAWQAATTPDAIHAFWLTLLMVAVAVPLNTIFGVGCALLIARREFRGKALFNAAVDIPFAVSPVVVGLALILVYGQTGWFGTDLADAGIKVIFNPLGMIIASIFISLPFVVRETVPVLREIGTEQEEAATTLGARPWQTFWRITLPAIRWGVAYGVVLTTARVLGEFGAVSVVSGKLVGKTETLPLHVQAAFEDFNLAGAYSASFLLAGLALVAVLAMQLLKRKEIA
jgi:sulfate/thiosulfate transport system permease protein